MRFAGIGLVMVAAICWVVSGGIADILMAKGWDPVVISFCRGFVGFICFFTWSLFSFWQNWVISNDLYKWALLAGVGIAGNFTFYFFSIQASSIAVAVTLMYTAPVFVMLISFLLLIERSTWFKWRCIVVVLIAVILLTDAYNFNSISVSFLGVVYGLASGFSYALFIFGFKHASSIAKPQMTLTIAFFTLCCILFLFVDNHEVAAVVRSSDIGSFLLLGIVGAGISFIIYLIGLRRTTPTTASMVAMIEPVTASLFGVILLGNQLTINQVFGMGFILVTITLLSVKQSDDNQ
ncbi:Threonine/homoserine efflux transporter RhtA [Pelagirhabdus alkalitolerans]|uniref:Threonine/homoserine efflux transporter RhtA n=1 Tax=Pelagirhabdus alkalitolerans TaxID=1612202 RepID=A0A1G6GRK5_9BACI|nr:DMT family transporter [Pelagirhabdus alkalitolerans]SDB84571.1 Threonine/homoserine efflux transporter RhtA [Pelagirhabdus alkalitolerans]